MSTNEVNEDVLKLIDTGKIVWPSSETAYYQFIADNIGMIWVNLLDINIEANVNVLSNCEEDIDTSTSEHASSQAWNALAFLLMLTVALENSLNINIIPCFKYDFHREDFIKQKAKVRLGLKS